MPVNLRNRSLCTELDFTPDDLRLLIGLAADTGAASPSPSPTTPSQASTTSGCR